MHILRYTRAFLDAHISSQIGSAQARPHAEQETAASRFAAGRASDDAYYRLPAKLVLCMAAQYHLVSDPPIEIRTFCDPGRKNLRCSLLST